MSSSRSRRIAIVASAAMLAVMLIGPGATSATVAGMEFQAGYNQTLPPVVGPNSLAGYKFRIHNNGSSNISQLVLSAPDAGAAEFQTNSRGTVCQLSPTLSCPFGSLVADGYIDVTVAYRVGTTGISVTFNLDSTGGATKDNQHSHGDSVSKTFSTSVNSGKNFAGGFQIDGGTFTTSDILGKKNPQSTSVHSDLELTPVNVTDGITTFPGSGDDPCATLTCVGDWAQITVGTGDQGPVEVKLLIYGQSVKGSPALTDFAVWHDGDLIDAPCTGSTLPTGTGECLTVSMQGNNYLLDVWLNHNGTLRGSLN